MIRYLKKTLIIKYGCYNTELAKKYGYVLVHAGVYPNDVPSLTKVSDCVHG